MANEKKPSAIAQYGPIGAPILGFLLAIIFIVAAIMTNELGEKKAELQTTREKVRKQLESSSLGGDQAPIPLPDQVASAVTPGEKQPWTAAAGAEKMLKLPILWQVTMDEAKGDYFDEMDVAPKDGFWTENEFLRTAPSTESGLRGKFENWDRNPKDGQISREEYEDPPRDNREQFDELDSNQDDALTEGEISSDKIVEWDDYPYDDKISFEEFEGRFEPKLARDLGAVRNVEAKVDPAKLVIVVKWENPDVADLPEDISFYIRRRAPETVEKRRAEYRKKVLDYNKRLRDWEGRFEKWWDAKPTPESDKTRKQMEPNKKKAQEQYQQEATVSADPMPQPPEEVSEWETVTENPVSGNEYEDVTFDMDVTYTYAVFMATKKNPKRGIDVGQPNAAGYYVWPEQTVAAGHPVIVRNRIVMGGGGVAGDTANISLTKWHSVLDADGKPSWYKVRVTERVNPSDMLGGKYRMADLKDRDLEMFDVNDTAVSAVDLLPSDTEIDFTTGFSFVIKGTKGFLMQSRELGDFELPTATRGPVQHPTEPPSTDNALEIRCLTVKNGGKEGKFELTRWHQSGDAWLRVVMTVSVSKGKEVGGSVSLASPGSDVQVFDATGKELKGGELAKHASQTVDLSAGTYEDLKDRSFTVGGSTVDLFGTIYK